MLPKMRGLVRERNQILYALLSLLIGCLISLGMTHGPLKQSQQEQIIRAEGVTALIGNRAIERDRAVQDALKNAVQRAVGTFVSSETLTKNFQIVYDRILTRSQGYVRSWEILSEKEDGDLFRMELEANVGLGSIESDLGAIGLLLERMNLPRVLVLIAEENVLSKGSDALSADLSIAETTLLSKLKERGFNCLDAKAAKAALSRERAIKLIEGDISAAQAIGHEYGAELVITGKAITSPQEVGQLERTGFKSVRADITVRAFTMDNGRILAINSASRPAAQLSEQAAGTKALQEASDEVADKIIGTILADWNEQTSSSTLVQVHISGLRALTDLEQFNGVLRERIRGVESIYPRDFALNSARLDVRFIGNAQTLARDIQRTRFGFCKAYVIGVTQNVIMVRLSFD